MAVLGLMVEEQGAPVMVEVGGTLMPLSVEGFAGTAASQRGPQTRLRLLCCPLRTG